MALTISSDKTNSVIGRKSLFEGQFHINGTLRIDGKFEGRSLRADQLYIGRSGRVKTNITASNVVVEGIIIGNIVASNRVMLLPTSRILGDIRTPELIIQNGVILEGRCKISHKLSESAKTLIEQMYKSEKEQ
ncbi:MAG: polymer-forming cytoskeletal protein [Actinomycetia bacterium]|nr:polymer-forming cytoskeletal protein [Actinomycetes bacterium]